MENMKINQERNNKIIELSDNGYSFVEIGKMFNLSRQRISQIYNHKIILKEIKCEICGNIFFSNRRKYCEKHNLSYKKQGRELTREKIRIRDNHTCQICGKKWKPNMRSFDVHHIEQKNGVFNNTNCG